MGKGILDINLEDIEDRHHTKNQKRKDFKGIDQFPRNRDHHSTWDGNIQDEIGQSYGKVISFTIWLRILYSDGT